MSHCSIGKLAFLMNTAIILVTGTAVAEQETRSPEAQQQWQHYPSPSTTPKDAPNVLIIMTDDVGFGASSTFGGIVPTPNLDRLAHPGVETFIGRLSAIELIEDLEIPYSAPGVVQSIKVSF